MVCERVSYSETCDLACRRVGGAGLRAGSGLVGACRGNSFFSTCARGILVAECFFWFSGTALAQPPYHPSRGSSHEPLCCVHSRPVCSRCRRFAVFPVRQEFAPIHVRLRPNAGEINCEVGDCGGEGTVRGAIYNCSVTVVDAGLMQVYRPSEHLRWWECTSTRFFLRCSFSLLPLARSSAAVPAAS